MTVQSPVPVSSDEILALRRSTWADGEVDPSEAEDLFRRNDAAAPSAEWTDFFVEALTEYLISRGVPRGYVTEADAAWLIDQIERDGRVDSMAELELIAHLFDRAMAVPTSLKDFAMKAVEAAVLTGTGPTRNGGALDDSGINATEAQLLRRFIFSQAGDGPASVSRDEAELLFRLKDATAGKANDPAFKTLFVQGVANHLMAHQAWAMPTAERELAMQRSYTPSVSGFFTMAMRSMGSMSAPRTIIDEALHGERNRIAAFDAAVHRDAEVEESEKSWLSAQVDADGRTDEYEQALLDFLAEERNGR